MGYRLKFGPRPGFKIKGTFGVAFPIVGRFGLVFERLNNIWYGDLDYSLFAELTSFTASEKLFAVYDRTTGIWNRVSLSTLVAASQTQQIITTGNATVAAADGLIVINKTVGAATTVTLGAASAKIGPVKIADFKGDAGTNNITINAAGSDKFSGNLSSWVIGADTGSVVLHPTTGGWAV